ncbi:MAG: hypothetical protein GF364_16900 [Candidatus Lokiarchaeota archaeon]|nr:hypothetical protein [Candidatus Lokiarchaeota archaeon]
MDERIKSLVAEAIHEDPDILVLPERWRPIPELDHIRTAINDERGSDYIFIKTLAKNYGVSIISGGIWEKRRQNEQDKFFITTYYFNESGDEIGRQDKIHLYSYEPYLFTPGNQLKIFEYKKKKVFFTILICFDVAFYETPRLSVENGAEILISPTLIREDGLENWKTYLKARALENRVPIVACNPVGDFFGRHFPGGSKAISFKRGHESPAVLIVEEAKLNKKEILTSSINLSYPNRIRKKRLSEKKDSQHIEILK